MQSASATQMPTLHSTCEMSKEVEDASHCSELLVADCM